MCMSISTTTGRVYRPRDCEHLILFLKDLNLPKPDKWGTSQLIAFLQQVMNVAITLTQLGISLVFLAHQVLTYNGFYDNSLEWVGLEGIQLVASINPSGSLGRHQLSTRFTSIVRLCCMEYSSSDQLQVVYGTYLQPVVHGSLSAHPVWRSTGRLHSLAGSMMRVYEQVCVTSCCTVNVILKHVHVLIF